MEGGILVIVLWGHGLGITNNKVEEKDNWMWPALLLAIPGCCNWQCKFMLSVSYPYRPEDHKFIKRIVALFQTMKTRVPHHRNQVYEFHVAKMPLTEIIFDDALHMWNDQDVLSCARQGIHTVTKVQGMWLSGAPGTKWASNHPQSSRHWVTSCNTGATIGWANVVTN